MGASSFPMNYSILKIYFFSRTRTHHPLRFNTEHRNPIPYALNPEPKTLNPKP